MWFRLKSKINKKLYIINIITNIFLKIIIWNVIDILSIYKNYMWSN
jgi:hypothetical protein